MTRDNIEKILTNNEIFYICIDVMGRTEFFTTKQLMQHADYVQSVNLDYINDMKSADDDNEEWQDVDTIEGALYYLANNTNECYYKVNKINIEKIQGE